MSNTREFVAELESGDTTTSKTKPVVTYCTGGIRCEVLSGLMRSRGFGEVYQLDGGIVRYGETFGDDGLWEGSLYVFDGRGLDRLQRPRRRARTLRRLRRGDEPDAQLRRPVMPRAARGVRELLCERRGCALRRASA